MSATRLNVSLVTTVLNDYQGCIEFFEQMESQTCIPTEIVIVDGGSKDGTWEFLKSYQPKKDYSLQVLQEIGCNVAQGRNLAIANAHHDLIVSTDIGCLWDNEWLEELIAPLVTDSSVDYVVGSWAVKFESLKSNWAKTEFVLRGGHIFQATPEADATSRSIAYRKQTWRAVGGYPEDLTLAADDTVFMLLLKKHGFKASAAPIVRCYWHRFERLHQFLKEERRNFYGDGEAFIRTKHFILVGGRILLELMCLLATALLFASFPWSYLGITALLIFISSAAQRSLRLLPKANQLVQLQVNFALLRLLAFDYLTKLWGLWGYILGFWRGTKYCRDCRIRIYQASAMS